MASKILTVSNKSKELYVCADQYILHQEKMLLNIPKYLYKT